MNSIAAAARNDSTIVDATRANSPQRFLLYAFIGFALTVFIIAIAMLFSSAVADRLLPYYGWPSIGFFYVITLNHAIPPLLKRNPFPVHTCFKAMSSTLLVIAGYGVFTAALGWIGDDFDNPYLTVAWAQPVWTVVVPLVWFTLFRRAMYSTSPQPPNG